MSVDREGNLWLSYTATFDRTISVRVNSSRTAVGTRESFTGITVPRRIFRPDYLWLRLFRTAFERFIECLACAGHANSELNVYSMRVSLLLRALLRRAFALSLIRPVRSNYSFAKLSHPAPTLPFSECRPIAATFLPGNRLGFASFYPSVG